MNRKVQENSPLGSDEHVSRGLSDDHQLSCHSANPPRAPRTSRIQWMFESQKISLPVTQLVVFGVDTPIFAWDYLHGPSVPVAADESRFNNKTSPGEELVSPICPNREGCCLGFRESLCFVSQSRPRIFIFSFFPVDLLHLVLPADSLRRSLTLSLSLALPFGAAVPPTDGVRLKIESRKLIKHFRRRIFLPRGSYF